MTFKQVKFDSDFGMVYVMVYRTNSQVVQKYFE